MKEKGLTAIRKSARLAGREGLERVSQVGTLNVTFKQTKKRNSPTKINRVSVKQKLEDIAVTEIDSVNVLKETVPRLIPIEHPALKHLISVDEKLGEFIQSCGQKCSILEEDRREINGFKSLCKSIIYQQIHGKAAASIMKKFLHIFHPSTVVEDPLELDFPSPQEVLAMEVEKLRSAGLSGRKVEYIRDLASKFSDGTINDAKLRVMDDETLSKTLCTIKGIGPWTVDMFLMFDLRRLDVLPVLDLGVRRSMSLHFELKPPNGLSPAKKKSAFSGNVYLPSPKEMEELAKHWKPYRSIASWYMWRMTDMVIPE